MSKAQHMQARMIGKATSLALAMALALPAHGGAQAAAVPSLCPEPDRAGLLVRFLDVGQGDAALLSIGDGRHILVDGGQNATRTLEYLTALGVDTIALIIVSHHHHDHIGGLPAILASLPVTNVLENGVPATTRVYSDLVAALERSGARVLRAESRELEVGSLKLRIIPPWARRRSQNLASVGAVASFGDFRLLLTGDAEARALRWWTSQGLIPAVSVVKVGHHGGRNGTTPELVAAARPRLAVVSVGARNSYGHPDPGALALWYSAQAEVLRTDVHGTVTVRGCADGTFSLTTSFSPTPAGTR
jgi:beta-lactamase superfamily II metal-dependent hydrolase